MYLTNQIKEKIFESGFNLVAVHFWNGARLICVVVYIDPYENIIQGVIASPDSTDIYNDILYTCTEGTKIKHEIVTRSIFPNLDKQIERFKKEFPNHFKPK
jgi:hypothetical protein